MRIALFGDAKSVYVQHWCDSMEREGDEIHLISLVEPRRSLPQYHRLPSPLRPKKLNYFAALPYARQLIKRLRPDLVIAYYVTGYGTLGNLTGFHPIVQVTAGSDILFAPQDPVMRQLVRCNLKHADLVTAFAPHMTKAIRQLGVPEDRIFTLPPGIPLELFGSFRCSQPAADDIPRVIVTRSLETFYQIKVILEVARLLREKRERFLFTIVGEGSQYEKLVEISHAYGLQDSVKFTGFVPNEKLAAVLAQHNLYLSLAPWDGVSASLLEAMVVGLYPIVIDHAANQLWIQSIENGILMTDVTPQAIANTILCTIDDQPRRESAWIMNRKIVFEQGDLEHNSQRFLNQFRQVVAGAQV